jgi:hypothetical protein
MAKAEQSIGALERVVRHDDEFAQGRICRPVTRHQQRSGKQVRRLGRHPADQQMGVPRHRRRAEREQPVLLRPLEQNLRHRPTFIHEDLGAHPALLREPASIVEDPLGASERSRAGLGRSSGTHHGQQREAPAFTRKRCRLAHGLIRRSGAIDAA